MGLKKIFKSKKGIAIETAILSIIVIFSLCFLVTSLTLVGHYQVQIESSFILKDVELDQIGEDFINNREKFNVNGYDGFTCEVNEDKTELQASYTSNKDKIILVVAVDSDGKITKWQKFRK